MHKSFKTKLLILFVFIFNVFLPVMPANATESDVDQYCENQQIIDADNWWKFSAHTLAQTFTPSKNVLTSLILAVAGNGGSATVNVEIRQITGGDVFIGSSSAITPYSQVSWLEFTFPNTQLDTSKQYKIVATSTSSTAYWVVSIVPCYAGGNAIVDGVAQGSQDFGFATYGYSYAPPSQPTTPPVNEGSQDTSTNNTDSTSSTQTSTAGISQIDTSIPKPFLTSVEKNEEKVDLTKNETINLAENDNIKFSGTTLKDTAVAILISSDSFETSVNDKGEWTTTLDAKLFKEGEFLVQAQAQKDGKGSEKADFVKIKVAALKSETKATNDKKFKWNIYYTLGLIGLVLLIGAAVVAILLIIRKRKANLSKKPKPTPTPPKNNKEK